MHKKKSSIKQNSTQSFLYTQSTSIQSESFHKQKDSFLDKSSKSSPRKPSSLTRPSSTILSSMIQEKVFNLKSKFGELNYLREKLIEYTPEDFQVPINPLKPRVRSKEMTKLSKNKAILNGVIYKTDDNRAYSSKIFESESNLDAKKFNHKAGIDRLLFGTDNSFTVEDECFEGKSELEQFKIKLKMKERELVESERMRKVLEKQVDDKDKMYAELEDKFKTLAENNKSLKIKVNRLESEIKNSEKNRIGKKQTIENLSYIILSKDNVVKDQGDKGQNGICLKYMNTLNELYSSDKLAVEVLNKLRKNQTREAFLTLLDKEDAMNSRLEQTQASIIELESGLSVNTHQSIKSEAASKTYRKVKTENFTNYDDYPKGPVNDLLFSN